MFGEAIGRGTMRLLAVLLLSVLAAPIAGADDYFDLRYAGQMAAAPSGAIHAHPASVAWVEEDADEDGHCACAACAQMAVGPASTRIGVPDEALNPGYPTARCSDSSYRPEVYRPPSV